MTCYTPCSCRAPRGGGTFLTFLCSSACSQRRSFALHHISKRYRADNCLMLLRGVVSMAAVNGAKKIPIDIVSDTVCPWCYVGKRRMEKAITRFKETPQGKDVDFEVTWHPFQLNPALPQDDSGRNKLAYYKEKFGDARTQQMLPRMTETFADEGLSYSMGGKTGSTLNSHRLVAWALEQGGREAQDALVEQLFKGYFTQEQYVNDRDFLLSAAKRAGLPEDQAAALLDDPNAMRAEVEKELQQARMQAVSGVPNFTIGNKYQLSGAQDPSTFVQVFRELA